MAHAAFPRGNTSLRACDALGPIYRNPQFAALSPQEGQPAIALAPPALATIFRFADGLSDRQAADAVRARIAWKDARCLPLTDPGFGASVLSEFRDRLLAGEAETLLFAARLAMLNDAGLVQPRGRQRTDATHVLPAIRALNRLELVGEALRHALNTLAGVVPDRRSARVPPAWFARYRRRFDG